jgi:hypothetical protein
MEDTHEIPLPSLLYRAVESTEGDNQKVGIFWCAGIFCWIIGLYIKLGDDTG